jgi:hypothetical protein
MQSLKNGGARHTYSVCTGLVVLPETNRINSSEIPSARVMIHAKRRRLLKAAVRGRAERIIAGLLRPICYEG